MPDGERLIVSSQAEDQSWGVSVLTLESAEPAERVAETGTVWTVPWDVSPDGKTAAVFIWDPVSETDWDILMVQTDGSAAPEPFSSEETDELYPRFSPDGQWIAFTSDRTGRDEIYLKRYPEQGALIQVTDDGALRPRWSPDGSRLFFVSETTFEFMAVDMTWNGTPSIGRPEALFLIPPAYRPRSWQPWAGKMRDPGRMLVIEENNQAIHSLDVILNWGSELERLAPTLP